MKVYAIQAVFPAPKDSRGESWLSGVYRDKKQAHKRAASLSLQSTGTGVQYQVEEIRLALKGDIDRGGFAEISSVYKDGSLVDQVEIGLTYDR